MKYMLICYRSTRIHSSQNWNDTFCLLLCLECVFDRLRVIKKGVFIYCCYSIIVMLRAENTTMNSIHGHIYHNTLNVCAFSNTTIYHISICWYQNLSSVSLLLQDYILLVLIDIIILFMHWFEQFVFLLRCYLSREKSYDFSKQTNKKRMENS